MFAVIVFFSYLKIGVFLNKKNTNILVSEADYFYD